VLVERRHGAAGALPLAVGARDHHDRAVVLLDQPRGDDADHALVPALAGDDVAATTTPRLRPRLDLVDRLAEDALLDHLPLAVQRLELLGEELRLAIVFGEEQPERSLRSAQPARSIDPRREPEANGLLVDGGRVDAADPHQRAQSRLLCLGDAAQPEQRECAVLVDERDDVGDGRERNDVEVPFEEWMLDTEQRLRELPDDGGAAQALEGIVALQRRDNRARRERLGGAMVIGDDHLEAERARVLDLGDGGDPAVDSQHEIEAFLGEPRQRARVQAVALLETRR
jgi:hypothetical protein